MRHTNSTAAFARPDRPTPADFDFDAESNGIWHQITGAKTGATMELLIQTPVRSIIYRLRRKDARSCPLELLARLIVWFAFIGIPESKIRLAVAFLDDVIARVYTGENHRSLAEIDAEKHRIEAESRTLEYEMRNGGTAEQFNRAIEFTLQEIALEHERARELRRQQRIATIAACGTPARRTAVLTWRSTLAVMS